MGSGDPRKGLHYALEAWLRSGAADNGTFYICGELLPDYQRLLADKLRHPSIRLIGFTSDVAGILRQCDVLILSSIEEGSALVTYEARACGCVLLVSDCTGARCRHHVRRLVHPAGDVQTLTEQLRMLVRQPQRLARLRDRSLASLGELTWSHAARNLRGIYEDLCADRVVQVNLK